MIQSAKHEEYIPRRMSISREMIEHIRDPIKRMIAEEYVKKGYWTLVQ